MCINIFDISNKRYNDWIYLYYHLFYTIIFISSIQYSYKFLFIFAKLRENLVLFQFLFSRVVKLSTLHFYFAPIILLLSYKL